MKEKLAEKGEEAQWRSGRRVEPTQRSRPQRWCPGAQTCLGSSVKRKAGENRGQDVMSRKGRPCFPSLFNFPIQAGREASARSS